jgi:hypothetical protein
MFGCYAGTPGPSTNFYGGGNGTAVAFLTRQPFAQGSETVKVAGATKTVTTDYTYLGTQTINGVNYASGVTFTAAPANAATVTASYTAAAGSKNLGGPLVDLYDAAGLLECDSSGVAGTGGGWWAPDTSSVRATGTPTAVTSSSITDSGKAFATDQHRGYSIRITADPVAPTAVGQVRTIAWNTATFVQVATNWTVNPSTSASYEIADSPTQDGTHPTTKSHVALAAGFDITKVT